jgi:hypothetical protein
MARLTTLALITVAAVAACCSGRAPETSPRAAPAADLAAPAPVSPPTPSAPQAAPSVAPPGAPPPAAGVVDGPDGRRYAVVSTDLRIDECSGAGGEHYVFDVDVAPSSQPIRAHAGGHAVYLGLLPHRLRGRADPRSGAARWFVAELAIAARLSEDRDGNPDSSVAGWCLDVLPPTQGSVFRVIPVADRDEGRRLLAEVVRTGLPRLHATLAAAPPRAVTSLAIVRVRERAPAGDGHHRVDVVDGAAPDVVDLGALPVWTGDLVVAELAGLTGATVVTRALVADDLADARRWKSALAAGWPPDAQPTGWAGAYATARWATVGKVTRGAGGCGPELSLSSWDGSSFQITPPRVAAPPGVRPGDVIGAVVVPLASPDGCGRSARLVRAYATPGQTRATWLVAGEPAPAPPLVE